MNFLNKLKQNNLTENTKGSKYYDSTYSANLDVFTALSRFNDTDEIIEKFRKALAEDETIALANLLYILDIRNGKGERLLFKTIFKYLCKNNKELALKILPFISELGRWDYIFEGVNTTIDSDVTEIIKNQLKTDLKCKKPSLLAKWLPSHGTHNENSILAKTIIKKLGITEKEYRKILTDIRNKLNLIETSLTTKDYESIEFSHVPSKAMLKYNLAFTRNCEEKYKSYLIEVKKGNVKINTKGLFCYEIVENIALGLPVDEELYEAMWTNQKDILNGISDNFLVVADTSGSMTSYGCIPYANSIGLAIYLAERNNGIFKNHFITFADNPSMQEVIGKSIVEKVKNIKSIVGTTDIDKVFKLILKTAKENKIKQDEMPSKLIIVSDMEFDQGCTTKEGTNLQGWRETFDKEGYKLPKIIFWNVACNTMGVPATKFDNDVIMVSGFSTTILENLTKLEEFTPENAMMHSLKIYIEMLRG